MRQPNHRLKQWLIAFLALLPLAAIWSVSSPMFSGADEPDHLVRAQGFSHFDFSAPYVTDGIPVGAVGCYRFEIDIPASCMDLGWKESGSIEESRTENYPPLLHAISAIPYFFIDGVFATYVVRFWLALLNTIGVCWAIHLSLRRREWQFTGLLLALTPTAVFAMGTVSPTGLAVTGSVLFVTSALNVGSTRQIQRSDLLAILTGAVTLATSRRDGAVWLVVLLFVIWVRSGRPLPRLGSQKFTSSRALHLGLPLTVALGSLWAVRWLSRFFGQRAEAERSAWRAAKTLKLYFHQLIGTFGWLDSPMGPEALFVATLICGFLVVFAFMIGSKDDRRAIALSVLLLMVIPVIFGSIRYPYFQGRYLLPLWVALLVVSGNSIDRGLATRINIKMSPELLIGGWALVHVWSLVNNLKRFSTGRNGSWNIFASEAWHPPGISNLVVVPLIVLSGGSMFYAARALQRRCGDAS